MAEAKRGLHVLVVDDYAPNCALISDQLEFLGHTSETAVDGQEALEKFRATPFDLIITDWLMPRMTGAQLAEAIHDTSPHTPIIMITALDDPMQLSNEPPQGVSVVLSKPVPFRTLEAAIIQLQQRSNPCSAPPYASQ